VTTDRVLGRRPFIDGAARAVMANPGGRQYVLGYDGEPVFGVWLVPADVPLVEERGGREREEEGGGDFRLRLHDFKPPKRKVNHRDTETRLEEG
jgi:hypothetical protein